MQCPICVCVFCIICVYNAMQCSECEVLLYAVLYTLRRKCRYAVHAMLCSVDLWEWVYIHM